MYCFFDFYRTAKVNIFKYLGKDYLQKFFFIPIAYGFCEHKEG